MGTAGPIIVVIDGQRVPPEQATVSVFDRGFLYGDGCFEVLRTWNGIAIDLGAHLERLRAGCAALGLRHAPLDLVDADVREAVAAAGAGEHRIRIVVTRGPGGLDRRFAELGPGRRIVIVEPLPPQPAALTAVTVDWPLPARAARGVKLLAYADHLVARELAREAGADEAIRLDHAGFVAEGATCNVFVVTDGVVATPPVDAGILPGVTRARVLDLCGRRGIPSQERRLSVDELRAADEWFATSALRGVVPITSLDGARRGAGPVTVGIQAAFVADFCAV